MTLASGLSVDSSALLSAMALLEVLSVESSLSEALALEQAESTPPNMVNMSITAIVFLMFFNFFIKINPFVP
jgi:hypothetical protein